MTFGQYLQNIGIILAQWIPVACLFYIAVRRGYQDGAKDAGNTHSRKAANDKD